MFKLSGSFFLSLILVSITCGAQAAESDTSVHAEILVQSSNSWNGELLPAYPAGQPEISVIRITIPAGSELPFHQHPVINVGYLLKGTLLVETDIGQTLRLQAGDSLIEVVGRWHKGHNDGAEAAEILVVYAGVIGTAITVNQ